MSVVSFSSSIKSFSACKFEKKEHIYEILNNDQNYKCRKILFLKIACEYDQ